MGCSWHVQLLSSLGAQSLFPLQSRVQYRNVTDIISGWGSGVAGKCSYEEGNKHTWLKAASVAVLGQVPSLAPRVLLCLVPHTRKQQLHTRPGAEGEPRPGQCLLLLCSWGLAFQELVHTQSTEIWTRNHHLLEWPQSTPHRARFGVVLYCRVPYRALLLQTDPAWSC